MVTSWRGGPRAVANPWRALTLEWQVSSPPPVFNFDTVPTVVGGPYEYGVPGAVHGIFAPAPVPATVGAGTPDRAREGRGLRERRAAHAPGQEILVVANRTLGGEKLLEAVRAHAASGTTDFRLVVPQSKPSAGLVIYEEAVRESAQVRIDLALSTMHDEGIEVRGEVGDQDPFLATMDAIAERRPDELIVSTHPATSSGWLRRDLIERIGNASGLPVEHIVTDLEREGLPYDVTLVVANKTSTGEELIEHLKRRASHDGKHLFIAVVPQQDGGGDAPREARGRLAAMLEQLRDAGLVAAGMIGDPDPYTATVNALELFTVDDVVISTLPGRALGLAARQPDRARPHATSVPVEHVVVDLHPEATAAPAA